MNLAEKILIQLNEIGKVSVRSKEAKSRKTLGN